MLLTVRVRGLTSLRKALRVAGEIDALAGIGVAFGDAAALIVAEASTRAASAGRAGAHLSGTYRGTRSKVKAAIIVGRDNLPYGLGTEFGAGHDVARPWKYGTRLGWNQFPPAKKGGYFLYPAAAAKNVETMNLLADAILAALGTDDGD